MSNLLHDSGEEFIMRLVYDEDVTKPSSVYVGLYNDTTDNLTDASDIGAITTEPTGGLYARQSVAFGTAMAVLADANNDFTVQFDDVVFDVSDSSQEVDSVFVVINYQRQGGSTASDHLLFTAPLDQSTNLSQINGTLTAQDTGHSLT